MADKGGRNQFYASSHGVEVVHPVYYHTSTMEAQAEKTVMQAGPIGEL